MGGLKFRDAIFFFGIACLCCIIGRDAVGITDPGWVIVRDFSAASFSHVFPFADDIAYRWRYKNVNSFADGGIHSFFHRLFHGAAVKEAAGSISFVVIDKIAC